MGDSSLKDTIDKHSQSSHPHLSPTLDIGKEICVAIFVVDVSVAGSSAEAEDSPTQGRTVLPQMLIKPPLRNMVLEYMQIWEQN